MIIKTFKSIILSVLIYSYSYSCEVEVERSIDGKGYKKLDNQYIINIINKNYLKGLYIVGDYKDLNSVVLNFKEAYYNFKNASNLGHIASMYHLGLLHEIAANHDYEKNIWHIDEASRYFGMCSKYGVPGSYEAFGRMVAARTAAEKSKKIKQHIKNILNLLNWHEKEE